MAGVGLFARQPAETLSLIAGGREGGHQGLSSVKSRGRLASTARGRRHHQHNRTPRDTRTQHLAPASPRAATAARSALRTGQRPLTQALFGAFFLCSHMAVNMCYRPHESEYCLTSCRGKHTPTHPHARTHARTHTHTPRPSQLDLTTGNDRWLLGLNRKKSEFSFCFFHCGFGPEEAGLPD